MAQIETTAGPVEADQLGRTLVHEHLKCVAESTQAQFPHLYDAEGEYGTAVEWVGKAMDHGVETIVDPACMDLGRDAPFAKRVADEAGINLVLCTGIYGQHYTFIPHHFETHDEDYLADVFVHDIEEGIQGTGIKAAFLKAACDEPGMTDDVTKVHRAAARASNRTGRPIMAHSRPASGTGLEQMTLFAEEGVDPRKVQIAHTGDTDDLDYIEKLLETGCWIGMDRYGTGEVFLNDDKRNATVVELAKRGYADRMMLSQDACAIFDWFPGHLRAQLAPKWTYWLLFEEILDQLSDGGVTDEQISTMLDRNPTAWLTA